MHFITAVLRLYFIRNMFPDVSHFIHKSLSLHMNKMQCFFNEPEVSLNCRESTFGIIKNIIMIN